MPSPIRKRSLSIIEMGFMYMRISKFCEDKLRDSSVGMVGQAFVSAIQAELLEFYRLLALFESQVRFFFFFFFFLHVLSFLFHDYTRLQFVPRTFKRNILKKVIKYNSLVSSLLTGRYL